MSDNGLYHVVFRTEVGASKGAATRGVYASQTDFEQWYDRKMEDGTDRLVSTVYSVVAKGITEKAAKAIVESPDAMLIVQAIQWRGLTADLLAADHLLGVAQAHLRCG